jgi:uncharacterized protein YciI
MRRFVVHVHDLERRGILFASGPLNNDDGSDRSSGGMSIFRVDSLAAATLADSEPFVHAGLRTYTLKRWGRSTMAASHCVWTSGTGTYDVV